MGLFSASKKNTQEQCDCGGSCDVQTGNEDTVQNKSGESASTSSTLVIKVFGPGCAKCTTLKENTLQALSDNGKQAHFEYITDMERIAEAGIMATPALEVNGKIVSSGKVLKPKDIARFLS